MPSLQKIYRSSFSTSAQTPVLDKKSALITGSTSGIGLCVAQKLASLGCKVMLTGIISPSSTFSPLEDVKKYAIYPADIFYLNVDLNENVSESSKLLVEESVLMMGNCDIIVNNAGMQFVSLIEEFPIEKYYLLMNVLLHAPFFITQAAIPFMRKNKFGRIINISSAHGKTASVHKSAYCMAKHGIIGLSKVTALEMGMDVDINWTCNALCPGWVETELAKEQIRMRAEKSGRTYAEEEMLLLQGKGQSHWIQPGNIADFIAYLCDDKAQRINGSMLSIDAGWTAN